MRTVLALSGLALVLMVAAAAAATPGREATIQFRLHFTVQDIASGALAGTFTATGGIAGSGRVAEQYILSPPRLRDQQPVESVGGTSTLTSATGTLAIAYSGVVSSASPTQTVTEGKWAISGGTGSFRGFHGRGRLSAIVDLTRKTMVKRYDGLVTRP
jgi:hypothetical protein